MNSLFLFISTLFILIHNVLNQCCLNFTTNSCTLCPSNMHLYRNNCIYDIPYCIKYRNGFDCQLCQDGFQYQEDTNRCIAVEDSKSGVPLTGFMQLSDEFLISSTMQEFVALTRELLGEDIDGLALYSAFSATFNNQQFYRLIFSTNQGFFETVFLMKEPTSASLFLATKTFKKQQNEQFINIGSDPLISKVQQYIRQIYSDFHNSTLIDAFKSYDQIRNITLYRTFMLDANFGLREITIKIDSANKTINDNIFNITKLDQTNLPANVQQIIEDIVNDNRFKPYLLFASLHNITQTFYANGSMMYNICYIHPDGNQNGTLGKSYFVVLVQPQGTLDEGGNITQNQIQKNVFLLKVYLFKKENSSFFFNIISDQPTNQQILSLTFVANLDPTSITSLPLYYPILQILKKSALTPISNAILDKSIFAQNQTLQVYQLQYRQAANENTHWVFLFGVDKQSKVLSLIRNYTLFQQQRQVARLSDFNREEIMQNTEPIILSLLYSFVIVEPFFNPDAKLVQITKSKYQAIDSQSKNLDNITSYSLKYRNPIPFPPTSNLTNSTISKYQFVQFRYEQNSVSMLILGPVLYPLDEFSPRNISQNSEIKLILQGVEKNIFKFQGSPANNDHYYGNVSKYQAINYFVSTKRSNIFRVQYKVDVVGSGQKDIIYQVDRTGSKNIEIIYINDKSNTTESPNNTSNNTSNNNTNNTNGSIPININQKQLVSLQQLFNNMTLQRFKQFIELQFYEQIVDKQFFYLKRINPENFLKEITSSGYTTQNVGELFQFVYRNFSNVDINGISIIVGLGTNSFQVNIVQTKNIHISGNASTAYTNNTNNNNNNNNNNGETSTNDPSNTTSSQATVQSNSSSSESIVNTTQQTSNSSSAESNTTIPESSNHAQTSNNPSPSQNHPSQSNTSRSNNNQNNSNSSSKQQFIHQISNFIYSKSIHDNLAGYTLLYIFQINLLYNMRRYFVIYSKKLSYKVIYYYVVLGQIPSPFDQSLRLLESGFKIYPRELLTQQQIISNIIQSKDKTNLPPMYTKVTQPDPTLLSELNTLIRNQQEYQLPSIYQITLFEADIPYYRITYSAIRMNSIVYEVLYDEVFNRLKILSKNIRNININGYTVLVNINKLEPNYKPLNLRKVFL